MSASSSVGAPSEVADCPPPQGSGWAALAASNSAVGGVIFLSNWRMKAHTDLKTGAVRVAGLQMVIWSVCTPIGSQPVRSEEHTSELQSLMRISYAVFCLKKKTTTQMK